MGVGGCAAGEVFEKLIMKLLYFSGSGLLLV